MCACTASDLFLSYSECYLTCGILGLVVVITKASAWRGGDQVTGEPKDGGNIDGCDEGGGERVVGSGKLVEEGGMRGMLAFACMLIDA